MKQLYFLFIIALITVASSAQTKDTTDGHFRDDLLDHLVGKWNVTGIVHGMKFQNLSLEATWIMNHQYLQIHEKGTDTVPFIKMPWEAMFIIGYNHSTKQYVFYELTVRGVDEPYEGFSYASRSGNQLKVFSKIRPAEMIIQSFTWQPSSNTWHIESRIKKDGKEGDAYLDLKAIPANSN